MLPPVCNSPINKTYKASGVFDVSFEKRGHSISQVQNGSVDGFGVSYELGVTETEKVGAELEVRGAQGWDHVEDQDGNENCQTLGLDESCEEDEADRTGVVNEEPEFKYKAVSITTAKSEGKKLTTEDGQELIDLKVRLTAVLADSKAATTPSELAESKKKSTALVARINKIKRKMDVMLVNLPIPYQKERPAQRQRKPYGELSLAERKRKREEAKEDWRLDTEVLPSTRAAKMKKLTDVELALQDAGLVVDEEAKEDLGIFSEGKEKKRIRQPGSARAKKGDLIRREGETLWEMWSQEKPFHASKIQQRE